jgi:hypothetical protein
MNLADALSYFCASAGDEAHYIRKLANEAEVEAMRATLEGERESTLEAFETMVAFARTVKKARKLSPAAKTLTGYTILSFLFDGPTEYGKLSYHVWRRHRHTRAASRRLLRRFEDDGVMVCGYGNHERVSVQLSPEVK